MKKTAPLAYGLNLGTKRSAKSAFLEAQGTGDDDGAGAPRPSTSASSSSLSSSSLAAKRSEDAIRAALAEDSTAFEYDAVYADMKAREDAGRKKRRDESARTPRYMENLLQSAAIRKVQLLRAAERKYKRERDEEEDEFGGAGEEFITGAYRDALAKVRQLDAEEEVREKRDKAAAAAAAASGNAMGAIYRKILSEVDDGSRRAPLKTRSAEEIEAEVERERRERQAKKQAQERALNERPLTLNASGEVIDKREMLAAGLNVVAATATASSAPPVRKPKPELKPKPEPKPEQTPKAPSESESARGGVDERAAQARARFLARRQAKEDK